MKPKYSRLTSFLLASSLAVSLSSCDVVMELVMSGLEPSPSSVPVSRPSSVPVSRPSSGATPLPSATLAPTVNETLPLNPPQSTTPEGAQQPVSGEYDVTFEAHQTKNVTFPIDKSLLKDDVSAADFILERYDNDSQSWVSEGFLLGYNPQKGEVAYQLTAPADPDFQTQAGKSYRYRIRVYIFSNQLTVQKEGSPFRISYYPSSYGYKDSVKKDANWSGSGLDEESRIPNFVEDLDKALNEVYPKLLAFETSSGDKLFKKLPEPIEISILDTGGSAGNSPLGGPAKISNSKITSYQDMREVAAHELVHVLQGTLYPASSWVGGFLDLAGFLDRWMIEASAQYFAAKALGLTPQQKGDFFTDKGKYVDVYLSVPIDTNHDDSFYALGDFLDWLSGQGNAQIVADTLTSGMARDVLGLSQTIRETTSFSGVGPALTAYAQYLLTHPDAKGDFGQTIKGAMLIQGKKHLKESSWGFNFTPTKTYQEFQREFPPLSNSFLQSFTNRLAVDTLLVLEPLKANGRLETLTYAGYGRTASAYSALKPLDKVYTLFEGKPLAVPHFGKGFESQAFEMMITNPDLTTTHTGHFAGYVLQPPKVTEVVDGKVTWSNAFLGNIPPEKIKGFSVYVSSGNVQIKKEIPLENTATQSFEHASIKKDGPLTLTVTDQHGNEWPEVTKTDLNISLKNMVFSDPMASTAIMPINTSVTISLEVKGFNNPKLKWTIDPYGIPSAGPGGELVYTPIPGAPSGSGTIKALDSNAHNIVFTATKEGPLFLTAQVETDPLARFPVFLNVSPPLERLAEER